MSAEPKGWDCSNLFDSFRFVYEFFLLWFGASLDSWCQYRRLSALICEMCSFQVFIRKARAQGSVWFKAGAGPGRMWASRADIAQVKRVPAIPLLHIAVFLFYCSVIVERGSA